MQDCDFTQPPRPPLALQIVLSQRACAGFLLMIALLLPLKIWRAHLERSLWIDEVESLLLATRPVAAVVDYAASDTNPPGYFLALRGWISLGRILGIEPSLLWARLPGVFAWLGLAAAAWFGGRKLLGGTLGAALAWAVAGSCYAAFFAKDARAYGFASAALFASFVLLWLLFDRASTARGTWEGWPLGWSLFALCTIVALWCHVLSLLIAFLLTILWFGMALLLRRTAPRFMLYGSLAHAAIVLAYLPWAVRLPAQLAARRAEDTSWVTPATVENWLLVFSRWFPLGLWLPHGPAAFSDWLGPLSFLVPVAMAVWALRYRQRRKLPARLAWLAVSAFALSITFVSCLWLIQRCGWATVFHGPRYPALAVAFWASGLVLLSALGLEKAALRSSWVWLLLLPWFASSALGQFSSQAWEAREPHWWRHGANLPHPGATLFVMPPDLIAYQRHALRVFNLESIDRLPCALETQEDAWVLNLNYWSALDRPQDTVAAAVIGDGSLAGEVKKRQVLDVVHGILYSLHAIDHARARQLCAQSGFAPAPRPIPADAAAIALPEEQRFTDGWSQPSVGPDLDYRRWGTRSSVRIVFDRPVPAGDYILHFRGTCPAHPGGMLTMKLRLAPPNQDLQVDHAPGDVVLDWHVHLDRPGPPILLVEHPVFSPASRGIADLPMPQVASLLRYAWLERFRTSNP